MTTFTGWHRSTSRPPSRTLARLPRNAPRPLDLAPGRSTIRFTVTDGAGRAAAALAAGKAYTVTVGRAERSTPRECHTQHCGAPRRGAWGSTRALAHADGF